MANDVFYIIIRPKQNELSEKEWKEHIIRLNNSILPPELQHETIAAELKRRNAGGSKKSSKLQKYIDEREKEREKKWDEGNDPDGIMTALRLPDNPMNLRL